MEVLFQEIEKAFIQKGHEPKNKTKQKYYNIILYFYHYLN